MYAILIDAINSDVVSFHESVDLIFSSGFRLQFAAEGDDSQLEVLVSTIRQCHMLSHSCLCGVRLRHPGGIHLIVEEHAQTDVQVVDLHAIYIILGLHAVDDKRREIIGGRMTGHGYHLVRQLLQLRDTRLAVGDKLPVQIGRDRIEELCTLLLQAGSSHQVGHRTLYPLSGDGCIAVHLRIVAIEMYRYSLLQEDAVLVSQIYRKAIERRHHTHLERSPVDTVESGLLLFAQSQSLLLGIAATGHSQQKS